MQRLSTLVSTVLNDATAGVTDAERRATDARREIRSKLQQPPSDLVESSEVDRALERVAPTLEEPPEELLRSALTEWQADRYLDSWRAGRTAVRRGEMYLHPQFVDARHATRFDALERAFDVRVDEDTLAFRGGLPFLTEAATQEIRDAVARSIGKKRKETLAALGEYGIPRPVVEHMDVDVRLAFDDSLGVRPVDATGAGEVLPEAVGGISSRIHFESEEVR